MNVLRDIPLPKCCDAVQSVAAVRFAVCITGEVGPQWTVATHDFLQREIGYEGYPAPAAKFCPFCGTALPKMRRKAKPPKRISTCTDGGYYCDTCKERLHACCCRMPESAWEPVPSSGNGEKP